MRIIHAISSSGSTLSANERYALALVGAQKKRGLSPMIITGGDGVLTQACRDQHLAVAVVPGLNPEEQPPQEEIIQGLIRQYYSFDAHLIHCHHRATAVQAIAAANRTGIPCTLTVYDDEAIVNEPYFDMCSKAGLKFFGITLWRRDYECLKKYGMPEASLYYVPNGTQAPPPGTPSQKTGDGHRPGLIMAGDLIFRKGIHDAILAMAELRRRLGPDCPALTIYGDGDRAEYLKEMTDVAELTDIIRFPGPHPDPLDHCASTDILILSSHVEAGPPIIQEAMSRGMPVIATDVGEVAQMLPDDRYGRVIPTGSIAALADAIESLLSDIAFGKFDPQVPIDRHYSHYTLEKMADRIETIYNQLSQQASLLSMRTISPTVFTAVGLVGLGGREPVAEGYRECVRGGFHRMVHPCPAGPGRVKGPGDQVQAFERWCRQHRPAQQGERLAAHGLFDERELAHLPGAEHLAQPLGSGLDAEAVAYLPRLGPQLGPGLASPPRRGLAWRPGSSGLRVG